MSKYNAIYGSFAFLPLLLIWLQLSWLILLFGCVLAYSLQNVLSYNFLGNLSRMSENYSRKVTIVLAAAIVSRFRKGKTPLTRTQLGFYYDIPIKVVKNICEQLYRAGMINYVMLPDDKIGIAPASETDTISVGELLQRLDAVGLHDFIPRFSIIYRPILDRIDTWLSESYESMKGLLIKYIELPVDADKEAVVDAAPDPFIKSDDDDSNPAAGFE